MVQRRAEPWARRVDGVFRENTGIYAGIEWQAERRRTSLQFLRGEMGVKKIRFPETSGIGIKPVSREGTERLVRAAIDYALKYNRKSVNFVHKGNIMKFTEGAFRDWGYALATREFRSKIVTERESWILGNLEENLNLSSEDNAKKIEPGYDMVPPEAERARGRGRCSDRSSCPPRRGQMEGNCFASRDSIADVTLQQVMTREKEFDVIATLNLNGDYLSDALAAQVGGIGIAGRQHQLRDRGQPSSAPRTDGAEVREPDKVNPGSVVLSGEMMLRHLGWTEAADLVIKGMDGAIGARTVTYDFARLMQGAKEVRCSEFGQAIIDKM